MSKLRFTLATLAVTSCGLSPVMSSVMAQQPITGQQGTVVPAGTAVPPGTLVQPTSPPVTTTQPIGVPPTSTQTGQAERYEARRVSLQSQQGPTVTEALVQKLTKANEAEIELAKMAMEKTDNDDLKQLAKMMVEDHQACNQKLQKLNNQQPSSEQDPSQAQNKNNMPKATVPKELCQIAEQACENALDMTKEMLTKYEGQDFNMAFLGQQCVAHTMMLAELKAIESTGPESLQSIAKEASEKVQKHLEKCKQLAKALEDDRKNKS